MDTFDQIPAAGLCRIHMDPEQPVPGLGHHRRPARAARRGDRRLRRRRRPGLRHAAAADRDPPAWAAPSAARTENGGALSHLDADWAMFGVGMPMTPELGQAIEGHLDRFDEAMEPWAADGGYFNFAERPCDADAILPARRLRPPRRGKRK